MCCAALWGNDLIAKFLLESGANVNATNEGTRCICRQAMHTELYDVPGTEWTALLAAAFQEHGKLVRLLLSHGADPHFSDHEGRTATDYASISESIWPFFSGT